jgi:hypothetical protein
MKAVFIGAAAAAMLVLAGPAGAAELDFGSAVATASPAFNPTLIDGVAEDGAVAENWGAVVTTAIGGLELTDRLAADSPFGETGLGVTNIAGGCTDDTCEALTGQGIMATAATAKISDAIIASIQDGESFNFFVDGTQINATPITNACSAPGFSALSDGISCLWTDTSGLGVDEIAAIDVSGSITLAATSSPTVAVPAPQLSGVGVLLGLGLWVLRQRWRQGRWALWRV